MTREELLSRLSKLLSSQFEQVLYLARIPQEHLPAAAAAQASRAVELMRYDLGHYDPEPEGNAGACGSKDAPGRRDADRRADGRQHAGLDQAAGTNFAFLVDSEHHLKVGERNTMGFDPARASLFDEATGARL